MIGLRKNCLGKKVPRVGIEPTRISPGALKARPLTTPAPWYAALSIPQQYVHTHSEVNKDTELYDADPSP